MEMMQPATFLKGLFTRHTFDLFTVDVITNPLALLGKLKKRQRPKGQQSFLQVLLQTLIIVNGASVSISNEL